MLLRRLPELALTEVPRHRTRLTLRGYESVPVTLGTPAVVHRGAPDGVLPGTP
jgi:hypothetical protein